MHPDLVRAYVAERVEELQTRIVQRAEFAAAAVDLDLDCLELFIRFDHVTHETEVAVVPTQLQGPNGQPIAIQRRVPLLGRPARTRPLLLHLELDGYDLDPPTAQLLTPDRQPLPADQWPTSYAGGGIVDRHPLYGRPFFCRPGLREYHSHPEHEDNPWHRFRDAIGLPDLVTGLLEDLATRWRAAA